MGGLKGGWKIGEYWAPYKRRMRERCGGTRSGRDSHTSGGKERGGVWKTHQVMREREKGGECIKYATQVFREELEELEGLAKERRAEGRGERKEEREGKEEQFQHH